MSKNPHRYVCSIIGEPMCGQCGETTSRANRHIPNLTCWNCSAPIPKQPEPEPKVGMNDPTPEAKEELWELATRFIRNHHIFTGESIWQNDNIIEDASREFVESICQIVGYCPVQEENND